MTLNSLLAIHKKLALILFTAVLLRGQAYSPKLLRQGQPDTSDLKAFAQGIYQNAGAHTSREKAEAIWRFFLTDGRFVKPGFFYHIAGWTYEEPMGEVLDPVKLLNSYGFGLCYHIAPLLEAVYEAGGFADARCWFLTGHTVAEVFYDGGYHYFDSDMMGYNVAGTSGFKGKPVSSVHDLEQDGNILLQKLTASGTVKAGTVDSPWYPADVRAHAIPDLTSLFTTTADNSVYPFTRYASGHEMDFVLRKGETLTRFFAPEEPGLFYLPYKFDGKTWTEFPQDVPEFHIRTTDGPGSQKDARSWATGRIDYDPVLTEDRVMVVDMPSPYVIIDAQFRVQTQLASKSSWLRAETSIDGGKSWTLAGEIAGPSQGEWKSEPKVLAKTAHGSWTAVSGTYGYRFRLTQSGADVHVQTLHLTTRFELNPRSLPTVETGANIFHFGTSSATERVESPASPIPASQQFLQVAEEDGQQFFYPKSGNEGYAIYQLDGAGSELKGFDVGARFLDIRDGRVPDKLTAEVRMSQIRTVAGRAGLAWSTSLNGPYRNLWTYSDQPVWRDGQPIARMLRWPEVFKQVSDQPPGTSHIYVKIYSAGPAFDSVRFGLWRSAPAASGKVKIMQRWHEGSRAREHVEEVNANAPQKDFAFQAGTDVRNDAVIFASE